MPSRRKFLAGLGTLTVTSLAGCSGSNIEGQKGSVSEKDVPGPAVEIPKGWKLRTPNSKPRIFKRGSILTLDWTAVGHTNRYENVALRNRVKEETLGRVDRPLMVAFATQIQFFPSSAHYGTNIQQREIDSSIQDQMKSNMSGFGLKNVSYDGKITNTGSGPAQLMKFTGEFEVEDITIQDVSIPEVEKDHFVIKGTTLEILGLAGTWKEGSTLLAAGGVYPNENFTDSKHWDITGAIDLDLSVNMGLTPDRYFDTITRFMSSVSPK